MKKSICLILILCLFFVACSVEKDKSLDKYVLSSAYNLSEPIDYDLGEGLKFKYVNYLGADGYLLTYLEDLPMDSAELQHISSKTQNGKYYISIDSYILEVEENVIYNNDVLVGILQKVYGKMTEEYGENMREHLDLSNPYILSGNQNCYYIDYLTVFNAQSRFLVYYHILIEDMRDVLDIKTSEWSTLSDNLRVLRECLGVYELFDYPKD